MLPQHPISTTKLISDFLIVILAAKQLSTGRTPTVGHSQQHNLTKYDMLPQHPISTTKLISDFLIVILAAKQRSTGRTPAVGHSQQRTLT